MRLTIEEQEHISLTLLRIFGADSKIYLFGSRTDDTKKGGDIDLLLITKNRELVFEKKIAAITNIQQAIGLQKIDLVVSYSESDTRPIVLEALKNGILLKKPDKDISNFASGYSK